MKGTESRLRCSLSERYSSSVLFEITMQSWFAKPATVEPSDPSQLGAYKAGRRDERVQNETAGSTPSVAKADVDNAYDRGRHDQGVRRRRHPIGMLLLVVLALIGVFAIIMPVQYGSFAAAGAAVDDAFASAGQSASTPVRGAADKAGDALQNAGQNLKQSAGSASQ
jgi:hypothetical protein